MYSTPPLVRAGWTGAEPDGRDELRAVPAHAAAPAAVPHRAPAPSGARAGDPHPRHGDPRTLDSSRFYRNPT